MRIHVIRTGLLRGNRTFMRAQTWPAGLLRRRADIEFPVLSFVVEHPEGTFAIDTGLGRGVSTPRWQRRFVPVVAEEGPGMAAAMREQGLDPSAVERVVLTHLDWDHAGGVGGFPEAEVLVHRPEYEAATGRGGQVRYQRRRWPDGFSPELYDLDGPPLGPFPRSRPLTTAADVHLVPLPGHSAGQIGVVVEASDTPILFAADHTLRWDWFDEDWATGRLVGLGIFFAGLARETSRRIRSFAEERGAIVVPSHDDSAADRLRASAGAAVGSRA
jgi:glyoxylase-like metal-dependent hydrolase (beta-lactamase superfamily II)